jgi:hypothetical protein
MLAILRMSFLIGMLGFWDIIYPTLLLLGLMNSVGGKGNSEDGVDNDSLGPTMALTSSSILYFVPILMLWLDML